MNTDNSGPRNNWHMAADKNPPCQGRSDPRSPGHDTARVDFDTGCYQMAAFSRIWGSDFGAARQSPHRGVASRAWRRPPGGPSTRSHADLVTFQNSGMPFRTPVIALEWAVGWKYSPSGR